MSWGCRRSRCPERRAVSRCAAVGGPHDALLCVFVCAWPTRRGGVQVPYTPWLPQEHGGEPTAAAAYATAEAAAKARGAHTCGEVRSSHTKWGGFESPAGFNLAVETAKFGLQVTKTSCTVQQQRASMPT